MQIASQVFPVGTQVRDQCFESMGQGEVVWASNFTDNIQVRFGSVVICMTVEQVRIVK